MRTFFYGISILAFIFLAGCSGDDTASNRNDRPANAAMLRLYMTDQPVQAKEVWITFSQIDVHQTGGGWESFEDSPQTLDLLTLENSQELVALGPLQPGKFTGFRFEVTEAHIIDLDDQRCDLKIPSGRVQVPVNFDLREGDTTNIVFDFDAEKSVHVVQRGHNESCILRPVVRVVSVD